MRATGCSRTGRRTRRSSSPPISDAKAKSVRVVPLGELAVDDVDMLTVVIVGSSQTRTVRTGDGRRWVYTPRGYAGKAGSAMNDEPGEGRGRMTVYFIGAGPGRARPHHGARAAAHRALPGVPLCRLAGAARDRRGGAGRGARARHGADASRRDHRRDRERREPRRGRRPRAFRRSVALRGDRRADAASRRRSASTTRWCPGCRHLPGRRRG